jgi:hypothetical protein
MLDYLKKLMKSKTIIVNSLTVAVGVIGYLAGHDVIAQNPEWVAGLVAVSGVVNVVLRLVTAVPVWEK